MEILKTTTEDGLKLSGLYFKPVEPSQKIIIHMHGMAGDPYSNAFLQPMFSGYPAAGVTFLSVENRGTHSVTQFGTTEDKIRLAGSAYEKFEECVFDIAAWIDVVKKLGYTEVWLQGHSLGCSKVAYYVSQKTRGEVAGAILLSPSDMIGLVYDPVGYADHEVLFAEATELVKAGRGEQLLSKLLWGEQLLSAATYINLFSDDSTDAIFNFGKPELGFAVVNAITSPVLAFTGTQDDGIVPVADPYAAMQTLEHELVQSPRVRTVVYDGAKHDFAGFGDQIVAEVLNFVN